MHTPLVGLLVITHLSYHLHLLSLTPSTLHVNLRDPHSCQSDLKRVNTTKLGSQAPIVSNSSTDKMSFTPALTFMLSSSGSMLPYNVEELS
jgi:hypothetical protein